MKCTQSPEHDCDNVDMKKCEACIGNMLCLCTRPEVRAMVAALWDKEVEKVE